MDFELPDELRMFKESLRRFVNNELIPVERQTVGAEGEEIKPEFLEKFRQRAKDLGIWMMEVPEEFGGTGLSLVQRTLVTEELSRIDCASRARRRNYRPVGTSHPLSAHRRPEGKVSDAGVAR